MKIIIATLLILISLQVKAQTCDTLQIKLNLAGTELIKFTKQYNVGLGLTVTGAAFMGVGLLMNSEKVNPLVYGGMAASLAGIIVMTSSYSHIQKAGMFMIDKNTKLRLYPGWASFTTEF